MHATLKSAIAVLTATVVLAALVSGASARNLSVTNQSIRATWRSLEFTSAFGISIRCPLTIEGSLHSRTIVKVERTLIGYITAARSKAESCSGGRGWVYNGVERLEGIALPNSLPWHLTYERFTGTLPNITSISFLLRNMRVRFQDPFGVLCIYTTGSRGNATFTTTRNLATGVIDNAVMSGSITPDAGSGESCPNPFRFSSRAEDGVVTLLGATTKITVTLI